MTVSFSPSVRGAIQKKDHQTRALGGLERDAPCHVPHLACRTPYERRAVPFPRPLHRLPEFARVPRVCTSSAFQRLESGCRSLCAPQTLRVSVVCVSRVYHYPQSGVRARGSASSFTSGSIGITQKWSGEKWRQEREQRDQCGVQCRARASSTEQVHTHKSHLTSVVRYWRLQPCASSAHARRQNLCLQAAAAADVASTCKQRIFASTRRAATSVVAVGSAQHQNQTARSDQLIFEIYNLSSAGCGLVFGMHGSFASSHCALRHRRAPSSHSSESIDLTSRFLSHSRGLGCCSDPVRTTAMCPSSRGGTTGPFGVGGGIRPAPRDDLRVALALRRLEAPLGGHAGSLAGTLVGQVGEERARLRSREITGDHGRSREIGDELARLLRRSRHRRPVGEVA